MSLNFARMRFLTSLTPEARQFVQQKLNGKSEDELAGNIRAEVSAIEALRLDRKRDSSNGEVSFVLNSKQQDNGTTAMKDEVVLRFKNVGGEWKLNP